MSGTHLVERVSALENRLARTAEQLERTLDLMLRQANGLQADHLLLDTLIDVLAESGLVERSRIAQAWRAARAREEAKAAESARLEKLQAQIVAEYVGPARHSFRELIKKAFASWGEGKIAPALRELERAAAQVSGCGVLFGFLGEQFFRLGKRARARDHLERACAAGASDARTTLLLGLLCGDTGDADRAMSLLSRAAQDGGGFAAAYALGRLLAHGGRWREALVAFRLAHDALPSPEANYLVALANYQLGRYRTALRHNTKALEQDPDYAAAHALRGCIYLRLGARHKAGQSFAAARGAGGRGRRRAGSAKGAALPASGEDLLRQFFGGTGCRVKRLLTGGDPRLAALLHERAAAEVAAAR